mgnify:CR=1 FL=1
MLINDVEKIEDMKKQFSFYGFPDCPLTDQDIDFLLDFNFSEDQIYSIGCDVNAGFPFHDAVTVLTNEDQSHE